MTNATSAPPPPPKRCATGCGRDPSQQAGGDGQCCRPCLRREKDAGRSRRNRWPSTTAKGIDIDPPDAVTFAYAWNRLTAQELRLRALLRAAAGKAQPLPTKEVVELLVRLEEVHELLDKPVDDVVRTARGKPPLP